MLITNNNSKEIDIEKAVKFLKGYMNTYPEQFRYETFSDKTYIDDILYGLGVSISKTKYSYAQGFRDFKKDLIEYLKNES